MNVKIFDELLFLISSEYLHCFAVLNNNTAYVFIYKHMSPIEPDNPSFKTPIRKLVKTLKLLFSDTFIIKKTQENHSLQKFSFQEISTH